MAEKISSSGVNEHQNSSNEIPERVDVRRSSSIAPAIISGRHPQRALPSRAPVSRPTGPSLDLSAVPEPLRCYITVPSRVAYRGLRPDDGFGGRYGGRMESHPLYPFNNLVEVRAPPGGRGVRLFRAVGPPTPLAPAAPPTPLAPVEPPLALTLSLGVPVGPPLAPADPPTPADPPSPLALTLSLRVPVPSVPSRANLDLNLPAEQKLRL
ncbi:hypothetical protein MKW98_005710 [Papaver atlanticum]|uniref:Uncharacterized protein n=1 Tax=Papaver atlanticum TaxID=357466 RepID=A0AAD4X5C0_9MAGN|nr:hypothetical protein MKW98_005710 [Papaver atlanticum]